MNYTILDSIKKQDKNTLRDQFGLDVLTGFSEKEKTLFSKYFYDEIGSKLFEKITESEDYYPTNCEFDVFESNKEKIVKLLPTNFSLIELGAGDGRKTKVLLNECLIQKKMFEYLPIDISHSAIDDLTSSIKKEYDCFKIHGVVGEYIEGLNWIKENRSGPKIILFLGSNIGNFNRTQSVVFLRIIWSTMNKGDLLLIGADLKKDIDVLLNAYNDKEKITSAFNLNVLTRMNNELGANFDINKFQHFGTYNPRKGAMESYIISKEDQSIYIKHLEKEFHFKQWEPIHMEYSYKYTDRELQFLADETGYEIVEKFTDSKKYFTDYLFKVVKDS